MTISEKYYIKQDIEFEPKQSLLTLQIMTRKPMVSNQKSYFNKLEKFIY